MKKTSNDQRSFFRIVYPKGDQPVLELPGLKFKVLDLSEGGCSFAIDPSKTFLDDETLSGTLKFSDRGSESIRGEVIRVAGRKVSIRFIASTNLPLSRIMSEQRYLIRQHKMSS